MQIVVFVGAAGSNEPLPCAAVHIDCPNKKSQPARSEIAGLAMNHLLLKSLGSRTDAARTLGEEIARAARCVVRIRDARRRRPRVIHGAAIAGAIAPAFAKTTEQAAPRAGVGVGITLAARTAL